MKNLSIPTLLILFFTAHFAQAQCAFDPTVTGDTLLCPNTSGILTTQQFNSYQWYKRDWGASTATPIAGATQQTLAVSEADLLASFSVEVTLNGCTETSPEVLLDGRVFALPLVQHTGNYTFDPVTEAFKICEGDTMFLTLLLPYDTAITWYKNDLPIPGENATTYAVTTAGAYTVEGAPTICPNYIVPLGLVLPVVVENCATIVKPEPTNDLVKVFPNPTNDWLYVESIENGFIKAVELTDIHGHSVRILEKITDDEITLSLSLLPAGTYVLRIKTGNEVLLRKIIKVQK